MGMKHKPRFLRRVVDAEKRYTWLWWLQLSCGHMKEAVDPRDGSKWPPVSTDCNSCALRASHIAYHRAEIAKLEAS